MNLDDYQSFPAIDPQNMLSHIDGLPDQLQTAWKLGQTLPLPSWEGLERVLIAGMGGSAIGADMLEAYAASTCPIPVVVHRDYGLPAWARGPRTLVIACSHSGNTEETLASFERAGESGCLRLAVATGGKLAAAAGQAGTPVWTFEHRGQPRAAVGFSFGLLLAAFARLNLIPNPASELEKAVAAMRAQQAHLKADVLVVQNTAKRLAGQLVGRWVAVFGSGILAPVARRWKCQINELAKAWAQFESLPEADHNTLAGLLNPDEDLPRTMALFLRSPADHPRNRLRSDLTRKVFMLEGLSADSFDAQGDTPLANLWTTLHFGDYTAYYLAMTYGVDPTPVSALETLKQELRAAG